MSWFPTLLSGVHLEVGGEHQERGGAVLAEWEDAELCLCDGVPRLLRSQDWLPGRLLVDTVGRSRR